MKINISGHHLEVTDAIRQSVTDKLQKVASHYPDLLSMDTILRVEKQIQQIEISTQFLGERVSVHASSNDLYAAISDAAKKLDTALARRKGSVKSFRHEKLDLTQSA